MKVLTKLWGCAVILFLVLAVTVPHTALTAEMRDYCIRPPFVEGVITPNLLLMVDNSASMYDLQYEDETPVPACCLKGNCAKDVVCPSYCYDTTYNNNRSYPGYFEESECYSSNGITYAQDIAGSTSNFTKLTSCAFSGCQKQTGYLCVTDTGITATGRFLNWLTSSKMDAQKQILTGGKYDTASQMVIGESRGCVGYTYIKDVPAADWSAQAAPYYTFGIRGDISSDPKMPGKGGTTRIDIYKGSAPFNNAICQEAIQCWLGGGTGGCKSETDTCLNVNGQGGGARATLEHSYSRCWQCAKNGPCCPENISDNGDVNVITSKNECGAITDAQRALLDTKDAMYICLKDSRPELTPVGNASCTMNNYQNAVLDRFPGMTGGYVGVCKTGVDSKGNDTFDSVCVQYQFAHYCNQWKTGEVVDPSSTAHSTADTGNIPASLLTGGLGGQSGDPITTHQVRISRSAAPTGVVHQFQNQIRFGAMTFDQYGSKAECGNMQQRSQIVYTCSQSGDKDAGRVIHHIGENVTAPTLNDISNLATKINAVQALTWTPYAESLYNAVAYFTQKTSGTGSPARLDNLDFDTSMPNPVQFRCQKNNILIISDGMSTTDQNSAVMGFVSGLAGLTGYPGGEVTTSATTTYTATPAYFGSKNMDDVAWFGQSQALYNPGVDSGLKAISPIKTYVVYTGATCPAKDADGNCTTTDESVPEKLMQLTAQKGGGTYARAENPTDLKNAITNALFDMSAGVASGTAASVLASSTGQGANLLQAVFYPKRISGTGTDSVEVNWIGELQNMWFFVDPGLQTNSIREDTPTKDGILDITKDRVIELFFDESDNRTKVRRLGSTVQVVNYEDFHNNLWEAGSQLWQRDPATASRKILTTKDGSTLTEFKYNDDTAASSLKSYLQAEGIDDTAKTAHAKKIINYVHGLDQTGYRERKVRIGSETRVWKLGDIVSSTPKVASTTPLNTYHILSPGGYDDVSYKQFVNSKDYNSRTLAFVGSNDGMLHALNFGQLRTINKNDQKAQLLGTNLGREEWAFIPKNALPYLKYLADPTYCHLYFVDTPAYLVDASISKHDECSVANYANCPKQTTLNSDGSLNKAKTSWRTILIGGMGLGGACKKACTSTDCVQTPIEDPDDTGTTKKGLGYSSYFALDITDTTVNPSTPPTLLWEFSDEGLGYALSGPAVVRVGGDGTAGNTDKNGRWYVVFASGPTGPIDKDHLQFLGRSDQNLKLFVLDLKSGAPVETIDTGIENAFGGSLFNATIDTDRWNQAASGYYQDDLLYVGYTKKSVSEWNKGGVLRVMTQESDPSSTKKWTVKKIIDDIGPVTTAVAKLQDIRNGDLWLYFGTGRYFFRYESTVDLPGTATKDIQTLYGVKEPCYDKTTNALNASCSSDVDVSAIEDKTAISATPAATGWSVTLDAPVGSFYAERVITSPIAAFSGTVFFTTFAPSVDTCDFGGNTFIWALGFQSGGAPADESLKGTALVQVSTGEIKQLEFSSAFAKDDAHKQGRRSTAVKGAPPFPAPPLIIIPPRPVRAENRIIHVQER